MLSAECGAVRAARVSDATSRQLRLSWNRPLDVNGRLLGYSLTYTGKLGSGWRRGVVVSGVRRMNEVNARRARLVPGWVTVYIRAGIPSRYVTSQLGQLTLPSVRGRLIEYQLRLG